MKKMLIEVVVIRVILIVLLVIYHAFAPFCGAWEMPVSDLSNVCGYRGIAVVSYSFMLEAFVFISGYVFGFQINQNSNSLLFNSLIIKKIKRLMFPCIAFGILYFMIFNTREMPFYQIIYSILNGEGHLWFLPMLFWCFVGILILEKKKLSPRLCLIMSIILAIIPMVDIPFRIDYTMTYFVFFYSGYYLTRKNRNSDMNVKNGMFATIFIAYIITQIIFNTINVAPIFSQDSFINKIAFSLYTRFSRLLSSSLGVCFIYILAIKIINHYTISDKIITLSSCCFGVYIFQQFILKILYYKTSFAISLDLWFPIIGAIIALVLSIILSWFIMQTKFGRKLIG